MTPLPALAPRAPGQAISEEAHPGPLEHSEQEWELWKDLIRQLYITENRKLAQIMSILSRKHGFSATEQMYKKRLRKWNFRKRVYRNSDRCAVLSQPSPASEHASDQSSDDARHEASLSTWNSGSPLGHYQPQSPLRSEKCYAFSLSIPIQAPCSDLEDVLHSTSTWTLAKMDSAKVVEDHMLRYLAHPDRLSMYNTRNMYRMFEMVFALWQQQKGTLAGMAARKAFLALEQALKSDHPDLLWHILDVTYDMVEEGHLQLLNFFLGHASALCSDRPRHPVARVLKQLIQADYQTPEGRQRICLILRQAWLQNVEMLLARVGETTSQGRLWLFEQLIWDGRTALRNNSTLQLSKEKVMGALLALETGSSSAVQHGEEHADADGDDDDDVRALRICALKLEHALMDLGDHGTAEQLAWHLLHRTTDDTKSNARFQAYARKMLARIYEKRGDVGAADKLFASVIGHREAAHGSNDLRVIRDMWVVVSYLRRAGQLDQAEALEQKALERAYFFVDGA